MPDQASMIKSNVSQTPDTLGMLYRLWRYVSFRRRIQFAALIALIILTSILEVFSIGALLPFLSALISPERIFEHPKAQLIIQILDLKTPGELLLPLTLIFVVLSILAAGMRLLMLWANTRITFATGADLSILIYRNTLYQSYSTHISRNSSEVISGITTKSNSLIYSAILPIITIMTSSVMMVMILSALVIVNPEVSVLAFGGFALIYLFVVFVVKKRLQADSHLIAKESTGIVKALQEGLGGIRDVLIDGTQEQYCRIYRNADVSLRRAQGNNALIAYAPRLLVEGLGMSLIALLAYWLSIGPNGGLITSIPTLGVLALGAQRILPIFQQGYASWVALQGGARSVQDALDLIEQPVLNHVDADHSPVAFNQTIELSGMGFRYGTSEGNVLLGIDLAIKKGERVGLIGTTGSGKSTLLDIVMGLLFPTQGNLTVDGKIIDQKNCRAWQKHIAHVPQSIFLADCSVEENIAFGVPYEEIDRDRVRIAARGAQIEEVIESLPKKYKTSVGERGVRLSGGQRQRIGIARALYKKADVIVFDEATSALDNETEKAVMEAIDNIGPEVTVLIIAHRLSTLRQCNRIVELQNGQIRRCGTYAEIVAA